MELTSGNPDVLVGLIDGPVATDHPDIARERFRGIGGAGSCSLTDSTACAHGTFVAGILSARRASANPGICPGCTVLIRPVFLESPRTSDKVPLATPEELAAAIVECVTAGALVLNLSLSIVSPEPKASRAVERALDFTARRGVLVVAAAGNQGTLGSSCITRHPWVLPVAACDPAGRPVGDTNLGCSIGKRGLRAPGTNVTSLAAGGGTVTRGGTSVAAPFVTGTAALLWSLFPGASAGHVRFALTHAAGARRQSVVPPLLDAWAAYQFLASARLFPTKLLSLGGYR